MKHSLFPALALLLLAQCQKADPDPAAQLPPATQTGANTFGCLVNGQAWTPSGGGLFSNPNLLITYDPTYKGGNLAVTAYRVLGSTNHMQYIGVGGDGINQVGTYALVTYTTNPASSLRTASFSDGSKTSPCSEYSSAPGTKATGQLTLTRLDKVQGIVSGTFNFTLSQPGCDTIKVTQGRFDYKL